MELHKDNKTIQKWNTKYTADCIQFCPIDNYKNIFIVGTYELDKETNDKLQKRKGMLYLFETDGKKMNICQEIEMPGILDAKWCSKMVEEQILLAIVNAEGQLLIYALSIPEIKLKYLYEKNINSETLALYVDWSYSALQTNSSPSIAVSDSKGVIHVYQLSDNNIHKNHSIEAHNYEAWIVSFNRWNSSLVYSGGDDSKFIGFDLRMDPNSKIFANKEHEAGVTSIQMNLVQENVLYTGSYDEKFRIWDVRNMRKSVSTNLIGGGLWRLQSNPNLPNLILASCMHDGFKIIDVENEPKVVLNYDEHQSLAYGADWGHNKIDNTCHIIASVSFYDNLLCLWKYEHKN